jgi:site-specific DNA-cytosine methylase
MLVKSCCHLWAVPWIIRVRLGKMEGEKNEIEFRKHTVYMAHLVRMKHAMCIHENVRGFPEEALSRELTDYTIHAATYDARQFGFPMSRTRVYRILTGPRARWRKEAPSFQEIVGGPELQSSDSQAAAFIEVAAMWA